MQKVEEETEEDFDNAHCVNLYFYCNIIIETNGDNID